MSAGRLCRIFFPLIACLVHVSAQNDYPNEYQEYQLDNFPEVDVHSYKKEIIRQMSGNDVILKCHVPNCSRRRKVKWIFKPCKADFNHEPCEKYEENGPEHHEDWYKVEWRRTKSCVFHVELKNVTEVDNGLYRCVTRNGNQKEKILRAYQLEVIEIMRRDGQRPRIVEITPSNSTVPVYTQVIIKCKVYSKHPLFIWWFKQSDGSFYDIKYLDKFYSRIRTSIQVYPVPNEADTYLSKLNIHNVTVADSGNYACVGVTEHGIEKDYAMLRVLGNANWEPRTSFSLLFLIPLAFALVPTTVWLCYYRKKKVRRKDEEMIKQRRKLIKIGNPRPPIV